VIFYLSLEVNILVCYCDHNYCLNLLYSMETFQVSDFGLARLAADSNTHVTTRVMGTFG
jgi:hypothetical protein